MPAFTDDKGRRAEAYKTAVAGVLLIAGTFVGFNIAPDYYDCGRSGVVIVVLGGFLSFLGLLRWLGASHPVQTALFCVLPWSLGLAGMAYFGFYFLLFELLATLVVLRRNTHLGGLRLLFAVTVIRLVVFLPIVVLVS